MSFFHRHKQHDHGDLPTRTENVPAGSNTLPTRTNTVSTQQSGYTSDDDVAPSGDPNSTLGLLEERLQAWKHMTAYLEDYIKAVAKDQKTQSKDSEKILKTLSNPLKEGHHFEQALGGVTGLFETLRANAQAQGHLYAETEHSLTNTVLPILERLHKEIKSKYSELDKGAGKQSKAIEHARNSSQKHIELLGQHTATFDSVGLGGKPLAANDPYVIQRGVWYRLNKQLTEENSHRSDLINIQSGFQQFENHVIATVQSVFQTFNQVMSSQHDRSKAMYGNITSTASNMDPNFEWNGFMKRSGHILISPNTPPRSPDTLSFPNMDHRATKPLIEGTLERKSKLSSYKPNYYAVSAAGFLHEYKDNDNFRNEPEPETSLYLPDCIIGAVDGTKFAIKGKDTSGSKLSAKLSMSSEYQFQARSPQDAQQWHSVIASVCAGTSNSLPNSPTSQTTMQNQIPTNLNTTAMGQTAHHQQGVVGNDYASPQSATTTSSMAGHQQQYSGTGPSYPQTGALPPTTEQPSAFRQ